MRASRSVFTAHIPHAQLTCVFLHLRRKWTDITKLSRESVLIDYPASVNQGSIDSSLKGSDVLFTRRIVLCKMVHARGAINKQ